MYNVSDNQGQVPTEQGLIQVQAKKSALIAAQVEAFIEQGGEIKHVPRGVMAGAAPRTREKINTDCWLLNAELKAARGRKAKRKGKAMTIINKKH